VFVLTQGFSQTFSPAKLSPFTGSSDSAAGDFNHDGLLDLVTVNSSTNQVALWLSNGDGTFRPGGVQTVPGASGLGRLVIGDFNHDGRTDLLGRTATGDLLRYYTSATGTLSAGVKVSTGWNTYNLTQS